MSDSIKTGSCLCGAVRFELRGKLRGVSVCHCGQCRKWSGHFVAATAVAAEGLIFTEKRGLKWFRSSDSARRGFCGECGSSLFWEGDGLGYTAVMAGTLDAPTGLRLARHIWTADCGDYYDLADNLPQFPQSSSS